MPPSVASTMTRMHVHAKQVMHRRPLQLRNEGIQPLFRGGRRLIVGLLSSMGPGAQLSSATL